MKLFHKRYDAVLEALSSVACEVAEIKKRIDTLEQVTPALPLTEDEKEALKKENDERMAFLTGLNAIFAYQPNGKKAE